MQLFCVQEKLLIILRNIINKKKVKIAKFGTFTLRKKNQRIGRNPKTSKEATITARKIVRFKASKYLKNKINNYE